MKNRIKSTIADTKWLKGYWMLNTGESAKVLGRLCGPENIFGERSRLLQALAPPTMSSTPPLNTLVSRQYIIIYVFKYCKVFVKRSKQKYKNTGSTFFMS